MLRYSRALFVGYAGAIVRTSPWMKIKTHYFVEKHSNMLEQAIARAPTLAHGYDLLMNLAHNNANKSSTEMTKSVVCVDMAGEVPLAGL